VGLALGLEGDGLAVGFAGLDGGVLAGEAEVIVGVVDDVLAVALATVAREGQWQYLGESLGRVEEDVLAAVEAWVWLQLQQGGMALQSCVWLWASVSIGVAVTAEVYFTRFPVVV